MNPVLATGTWLEKQTFQDFFKSLQNLLRYYSDKKAIHETGAHQILHK